MRTFGRYRLLEPLASGGMADVWRAEVTGAAGVVKEVALKLVRGEHEADSDFSRMFVEEARLACRLSHANVVQVFELDQIDGRYSLAMELVQGRDLARVVERARSLGLRLGVARAVHLAAQVATALAYVHRLAEGGQPLGLVHRDVSPHNVLVSFEGEVKLADFGIARAMGGAGLTAPGTVKGKVAYMAPEQARGEPLDGRADVFALGVILWELCAGRRLFARETDAATLTALLDGPPPSPPSAWNESVPAELDEVVLGALERDPARRPTSEALAGALGAALLRLAGSPADWDLRAFMHRLWPEGTAGSGPREPTKVRPPPPAPTPPPQEPTSATRTAAPIPRARRPRRALAAAAAALAACALLAGLWGRARPRAAVEAVPPGASAQAAPPAAATPPVAPPPTHAAPEDAPARSGEIAAALAAGAEQVSPDARAPGVPPIPAAAGAAAARTGELHVIATPWAVVSVGGRVIGETPVTLALPPGRHRVRATHPSYGTREALVEIAAGARTTWNAPLTQR
ncbi:MAG: serine/threonine-protein kinase [Anaeromyxobacter sp.]